MDFSTSLASCYYSFLLSIAKFECCRNADGLDCRFGPLLAGELEDQPTDAFVSEDESDRDSRDVSFQNMEAVPQIVVLAIFTMASVGSLMTG